MTAVVKVKTESTVTNPMTTDERTTKHTRRKSDTTVVGVVASPQKEEVAGNMTENGGDQVSHFLHPQNRNPSITDHTK